MGLGSLHYGYKVYYYYSEFQSWYLPLVPRVPTPQDGMRMSASSASARLMNDRAGAAHGAALDARLQREWSPTFRYSTVSGSCRGRPEADAWLR